jgi:putative membrane protein
MSDLPDRPPSDVSPPAGPPPPAGAQLAARRLHPAGAVLSALDDVRNALFSLVVLIVLGSRSADLATLIVLLGLGGAAVAVAVGYARWRAESYAIADGAIRHRSGVISPDETVVPLARVHSIDVAQGPVQHLFGVDELHVQTAGGGERGEIVLRAVSPAETARLRAAAGLPEPTAADLPRWRLSPRGLIVVGLTAPQLGMLLPLVGGAFAVGDDLIGEGTRDTLVDRLPTETGGILLVVAAVVGAAWLLSFLGSLVMFAGFAVVRDGDNLRIHRGFLQRRTTSVPLRRIHAITVAEGPLRRPFGLCSVRLETAGYGKDPAAARTLFPLIALSELDGQLARFAPALAGGQAGPTASAAPTPPPAGAADSPTAVAQPDFVPPPSRALRRYVAPGTLAVLVLTVAAALAWPVVWPAVPLLTALTALDGYFRYRNAGWRLDGDRVLLCRGSLTRRTLIARPSRLQDHSFVQTSFQREAALADVSVTVASGTSSTVSHIDATAATTLFDRLRPTRPSPSVG